MNQDPFFEKFLQRSLHPVQPRGSYIKSLKDRLLHSRKRVVEVEPTSPVTEAVTLATVGIGVLATFAAFATLGISLVGRKPLTKPSKENVK